MIKQYDNGPMDFIYMYIYIYIYIYVTFVYITGRELALSWYFQLKIFS